MSTILLFSGPIASGKTTLADELIARLAFKRLKSSDHLKTICISEERKISRSNLQMVGDRLDLETDYRWLIDDVSRPQMAADPSQYRWLIDSVRKPRQVAHFRAAFRADVFHLHVWAPENVLKQRFELRLRSGSHHEGPTSYQEAISHPNEISARALKDIADLSVDTSQVSPAEVARLIAGEIWG